MSSVAASQLEKKLFIISPIGDPDSETRDRSDKVKRHIIDEAAKHKGCETLRSDSISTPGRIDHQIIYHLLNDDSSLILSERVSCALLTIHN